MANKFEEREKSKLQIGNKQKRADKSVSKWQHMDYVHCVPVKPLTRLPTVLLPPRSLSLFGSPRAIVVALL